jgi:hypothetical protein
METYQELREKVKTHSSLETAEACGESRSDKMLRPQS